MIDQTQAYMPPLDTMVFNIQGCHESTSEEIQANLDLWANTEFTFDELPIPKQEYSGMTTSNITYQANKITYESLANYLDFELPQRHLLLNESKPTKPLLLPKIDSYEAFETVTKSILDQTNPKPHQSKPEQSNEEDKRKRNTAASARFRIKKKQKERLMEKTVEDMTHRSRGLESRVRELESEIKFLRGLLIEKEPSMVTYTPSSKDFDFGSEILN